MISTGGPASPIACTIVSSDRIAFARVLARSFREANPGIGFVTLLIDGPLAGGRSEEPSEVMDLEDLALPDPTWLRFAYDQQALSAACTPFLIERLLPRGPVLFLKQESLVLGHLGPLFDRLSDAQVVVTPHLVAPIEGPGAGERERIVLQAGAYNVGVLGVADGATSRAFLAWWQDRVRTHCIRDVAEGMHLEQRWIDLALGCFEDVAIMRDAAYNVGHWSLPERTIGVGPDGVATVDGEALRVFRFSGYRPEDPDRLTMHDDRPSSMPGGPAQALIERFRAALDREGHAAAAGQAYRHGAFDNGVPIPPIARQRYRELGSEAGRFGDPFATDGPTSYWHWLLGPDTPSGPPRLWAAVHRARPDLQRAFPDIDGADRAAFLRWARLHGLREHQVPEAMLPDAVGG